VLHWAAAGSVLGARACQVAADTRTVARTGASWHALAELPKARENARASMPSAELAPSARQRRGVRLEWLDACAVSAGVSSGAEREHCCSAHANE